MDKKETTYGKLEGGFIIWKIGPIEGFLTRKFPNEKETIGRFLYNDAPITYNERSKYPGFYKGRDEMDPLKSTDKEAEAYFI